MGDSNACHRDTVFRQTEIHAANTSDKRTDLSDPTAISSRLHQCFRSQYSRIIAPLLNTGRIIGKRCTGSKSALLWVYNSGIEP